jgi:hypothetical protein
MSSDIGWTAVKLPNRLTMSVRVTALINLLRWGKAPRIR